jgi:hypothetical protein
MMATICKADYYYGALLSALVNGGLAPALFEKENDNRQIYEVTTNKASYIIYTKYNTTPSGSKDFTWSFSFSDNEIEEIIKIHHENNAEKSHVGVKINIPVQIVTFRPEELDKWRKGRLPGLVLQKTAWYERIWLFRSFKTSR